ncbi:MAG: MBL fold metallo-hydrolase [Chitinophagales bacterium]|nr:MBL fold metallo-hydrolase [Chitinophagales bacterium]
MKVTFLGTGTSSGVPMIACDCEVCQSSDRKDKRLRCSIIVETDIGNNIVVDIGPDFRQQMLKENVNDISAVLITHCHRDHTAGLDDIRAFNFKLKKDISIYTDRHTEDEIKQQFAYIFAKSPYPGLPKINLINFKDDPFTVEGDEIIPIKTLHHKLPVYGFRLGNFTYITDANYISDEAIQKIKGSKVFVINALRKDKHVSHFTLEEALEIIEKVEPEQAYLTHLSHQMGLHDEVSKELPPNVSIAYDGLQITI